MSDFIRNVLRRGAGLAPVLSPRSPDPPEETVPMAAEELEVEAPVSVPPPAPVSQSVPSPPVAQIDFLAARQGASVEQAATPATPLPQARTSHVVEAIAAPPLPPGSAQVTAPRAPAATAGERSDRVPMDELARLPRLAPSPPGQEIHETAPAPPAVVAPEPRVLPAVSSPEVSLAAPQMAAVAVPPQPVPGVRAVESRDAERGERPRGNRRVQVTIGRIEVRQPAPPARRLPRGFEGLAAARRYLDRRWY